VLKRYDDWLFRSLVGAVRVDHWGPRFFSRDAGYEQEFLDYLRNDRSETYPDRRKTLIVPHFTKTAWSDHLEEHSPAWKAREALRESAGVHVPEGKFVLTILVAYLAVLVPVNWAVFRFVGRLEWAWIAAPVLALGGAVVVARLAQLDIGFVRSRAEITLVEMHAGHPQAHVSRFTALYTSLSTSYEARFDDPHGLMHPMETDPKRPTIGTPVALRNSGSDVTLSPFQVTSNSTRFLRSEQMMDLTGAITLVRSATNPPRIKNGTPWTIRDAIVVARSSLGELEAAPVDLLQPGGEEPLENWHAGWGKISLLLAGTPLPVELAALRELAIVPKEYADGDARLVGWIDGPIEGLEIRPAASQSRGNTLVVVNLPPAR
jgi:hypothetical protein